MMKKLLFVDDERKILSSLNRLMIDVDYEILTAESGQEALEILEEEPDIDLIISDMRMPYMTGYELLSIVKQRYPKVIRVILSGYTDEKIIYKALQENVAKIYLLKPWKGDSMLREIEHIFETEEFINSPEIIAAVNNAGIVKSMPDSYQTILNLIDDEASMEEISRYISADAALATDVLRIANSAFFSAKTGAVKTALQFIGTQSLSTFIRMTALLDSVKSSDHKKHLPFLDSLWRHAFLTNRIFHFIYKDVYKESVPVSGNSAGLLHNIGKAVMLKIYGDEYLPFMHKDKLRMENPEEPDIIKVEQEKFGTTHQQIGAYLLDGWDFPYPIIECTLYHHDPVSEKIINKKLVSSIHIAQKCAYDLMMVGQIQTGRQAYAYSMAFYPEVFEHTNLEPDEMLERIKDFQI